MKKKCQAVLGLFGAGRDLLKAIHGARGIYRWFQRGERGLWENNAEQYRGKMWGNLS
jgi:hypothetical protein